MKLHKTLGVSSILLVGLLGMTACAEPGSVADKVRSESSATATNAAESEFDTKAVTKEFVTAVYANDLENALPLTSPGSPAARYVTHQQATQKAYQVNGDATTEEEPTLTFDDDGAVTVTYSDGTSFIWTDFQFDDRGLVSSWVTPSGDLTALLWTQDWQGVVGANTYTLVSAYKANGGDLFVTLRVDAGQQTSLFYYSATLVGADSITYSVTGTSGPRSDITAGSSAFVVLIFPQAPFGGTVRLQGYYPDDPSSTVEVAVPVA